MAATLTPPTKPAAPVGCPDPGMHGITRPVVFLESRDPSYVASARMLFEEFLDLDYEHGLAEWVDGEVFLYMSATNPHQAVIAFLNLHLSMVLSYLRLGVLRNGPYAIKSPSGRAGREPDIFLIKEEHRRRLKAQFLDGNPDLVIEVVSDDSVGRDFEVKFAEYEASGIPEYWVIDPRPGRKVASFFVLEGGRYVAKEPGADGIYVSTVFPQVKLKVDWLFMEDPPVAEALDLCLGPGFGRSPIRGDG